MTGKLLPHRKAALVALAIAGLCAAIEWAMHRPAICPCGHVRLWWGVVESNENSQQILDWYSFSHVIHGFLFYGAAWVLWRSRAIGRAVSPRWALAFAVALEAGWELLENSPIIIERYRAVTVSWGYTGDSMLNSLSDISCMAFGFWLAGRFPWWVTVALAVAAELFTLAMIRDNLALNVLMLVWPVDAVRLWQAAS